MYPTTLARSNTKKNQGTICGHSLHSEGLLNKKKEGQVGLGVGREEGEEGGGVAEKGDVVFDCPIVAMGMTNIVLL